MSTNGQEKKPTQPMWWKPELYNYLKAMPLHGWVWEFMRRSRLKSVLKNGTVEAMRVSDRSKYGGSRTRRDEINFLSLPWPIMSNIEEFKNWLGSLPPPIDVITDDSIQQSIALPITSSGYFLEQLERKSGTQFVKLRVDLNRRNSVLYREFKNAIKKIRETNPESAAEPTKVAPRSSTWEENCCLQVWDLHEFKLTWSHIAEICHLDNKQSARNAYYSAYAYIEDDGWYKLALYVTGEMMSF